MALVGGGGAGNVAGGNPSGTGTSLNYIGDHAYGYSGDIVINNETSTALQFTTGSSYIVGHHFFSYDANAIGSNKTIGYQISFDDQIIVQMKGYNNAGYPITDFETLPMLIPPYTRVKIEHITTQDSSVSTFSTVTGRVYA